MSYRSQLFTGRGMSDTMYDRWRSHKYIAQSNEADSSDSRPNGRVFVTRGHQQRFVDWRLTTGEKMTWRAVWDEKYGWGQMPGQSTSRSPELAGIARNEDFRGFVELPHVQQITIRNNIDNNGIGTASITLQNVYREANTGIDGFIYHILREGFFSPHYNGDGNFDIEDIDFFTQSPPTDDMLRNEDGKVITGLIVPNRKVEIFQGYGDELQRTFVGIIDSVEIDSKTGRMTIECTDFGRLLSEQSFTQFTCPPGRYPVSFHDYRFSRDVPRARWPQKFGILRTSSTVADVTDVAGRIYAWTGFHSWNRVRAGRIGQIGTGKVRVGDQRRAIRAVFTGENFEKGSYFIDGINQIKTLLGYIQFITPDYHEELPTIWGGLDGGIVPYSDHFRDPDSYDDEYSRWSIGVPNFVPPALWVTRSGIEVEQFLDSELLLDGGLIYDYQTLRKNMYVTGTGQKTKRGRPRLFGYHVPFEIGGGFMRSIYFNVQEELGINLSEQEIHTFILRTMMNTTIFYNRGNFTIPGWPAVTINKQVDIFESKSGTWRRFMVSGFESEMTLGKKSSWKTSVEVVNIDNAWIRRIKNQLKTLLGVNQDTDYDGLMFQKPNGALTPATQDRLRRG